MCLEAVDVSEMTCFCLVIVWFEVFILLLQVERSVFNGSLVLVKKKIIIMIKALLNE